VGTIDDHEGKCKTIDTARTYRNNFVLATMKIIEKSILYSSTSDARQLKVYIQEERPHSNHIIDSVDLGSTVHPARLISKFTQIINICFSIGGSRQDIENTNHSAQRTWFQTHKCRPQSSPGPHTDTTRRESWEPMS
jgi:hypothetical protein